jgi:putative zinc finger protein
MTIHEHSEWTDRLSDYLDGELSDQEQRAVSAHVASCAECARTLDELRTVVEQARALTPAAPAADLWSGISSRIGSADGSRPLSGHFGPRRRFSFTWPELVAASLLLVLVSGLTALRFATSRPAGSSAALQVRPTGNGGTGLPGRQERADIAPASFDDSEYDAAVADLQRALQSGRGQLDSATVKVVEDNLAVIDQAVDDARRALAQDPANADLSGYLFETRQRKLALLRHAAALAEDFN